MIQTDASELGVAPSSGMAVGFREHGHHRVGPSQYYGEGTSSNNLELSSVGEASIRQLCSV